MPIHDEQKRNVCKELVVHKNECMNAPALDERCSFTELKVKKIKGNQASGLRGFPER